MMHMITANRNGKFKIGLIIIFGVIFSVIGAIRYFEPEDSTTFDRMATRYMNEQNRVVSLATAPGSGNNKVRQELNTLLSRVLMEPMSDTNRYKLSNDAIERVDTLDRLIDSFRDRAEGNVSIMENIKLAQSQVTGWKDRKYSEELVALMEEQQNVYNEIEVLMRVIEGRTRSIFERVMQSDGSLTDEHITALNEQLKDAEKQFDKKRELFDAMERNIAHMHTILENHKTLH